MECKIDKSKFRALMIILTIVASVVTMAFALFFMGFVNDVSTSADQASMAFAFLSFFVSIATIVFACIMFCTQKIDKWAMLTLAILAGVAALFTILTGAIGVSSMPVLGILAGGFVYIAVATLAMIQLCCCREKKKPAKVEKAEKAAKAE